MGLLERQAINIYQYWLMLHQDILEYAPAKYVDIGDFVFFIEITLEY